MVEAFGDEVPKWWYYHVSQHESPTDHARTAGNREL